LLCWLLFVVTKQQSLLRRDTLLLHRLKACWLLLEGLLLLQWLSECWLLHVDIPLLHWLFVPQTSDWLLLAELKLVLLQWLDKLLRLLLEPMLFVLSSCSLFLHLLKRCLSLLRVGAELVSLPNTLLCLLLLLETSC
jgi:hypothetical protein